MSSTRHTPEIEEKEARMPPTPSLVLVLYLSLLVGVNLVIVIPTADNYAHRLGADALFGGLLIGAFPLFSGIGVAINQWLLRRLSVSFKSVLLLLAVGTVLGNALYALAGLTHMKWTLLIARCLLGMCSGFNLPTMYIGMTVGVQRRSEIVFYFSALNTLGYALGPAVAAALEVFVKSIHVDNLVLDSDTAPGWFMAVLYLLFMAKVILLFDDLPLEATALKLSGPPAQSVARFPAAGGCASFWYLCVSSMVITAAEVYAVNVGQNYWGWPVASSALFLAALMLCSGLSNMVMGRMTTRFMRSDRAGLLGGSVLSCFACIPLFNFNLHAVSAQVSLLGCGLMILLTLMGLIRAFALAVSSKLVPAHMKSSMNSFAALGMTLGRGVGGVIGSVLDPTSFAPVLLSVFVVTVLVSLSSHRCMKPSEKAS